MQFSESYYKDPYLFEYDTEVKSCKAVKHGFAVSLCDTVFYPEGGGQPADRGIFRLENGEEIRVLDVQRNEEDEVLHYTDTPIPERTPVHEVVDRDFRFSLMQNHTGEHIVSGLIHRAFGYENVGFHMSDVITIDISGELSREQAAEIEKKANRIIWENIPVDIIFPEDSELDSLDYRSKKELNGKVRLIDIEKADLCACCGLHVKRTGEIGLIKILSLIRYKGGVRIEMVCGDKALRNYEDSHDTVTDLKNKLSVKPHELTDAVDRLMAESAEKSMRIANLNNRYFEMRIRELEAENGMILTVENDLDTIELRKFCDALNKSGKAGVSVVLKSIENEKEAFQYVIAGTDHDMKSLSKSLNEALNGRGGGSKEMIQGTFYSGLDDIRQTVFSLFR
ncbi:MAG: alanyl-tRNA editing protein [Lachnospiraceae bacterium]|nr:alanyl-tRNA editing protein [Lachnospiraceae bacterium]